MWKKSEEQSPPAHPAAAPPPARPAADRRRDTATIGASIQIKGDLTGAEDLVIQGRLEGEISLDKNSITVGKSGRVKADIHGQSIHVEGEVQGNLYGAQEVVIRASGRVRGNIVSPRVTLENGSKFKGAIDMEPAPAQPPASAAKPAAAAASRRAPDRGAPAGAPGKQEKLEPSAGGG